MKLIAVLSLVVLITVISSNATKTCGSESESEQDSESESKESTSESKESTSESKESTSEESCEEKPVFLKVMDVNRGVAHCGPENVLNTCACRLNELYWIPCMIEYLSKNKGVKDQPECYSCVSLAQLDCFLEQFPCQCMPHCPNGYGYNASCLP